MLILNYPILFGLVLYFIINTIGARIRRAYYIRRGQKPDPMSEVVFIMVGPFAVLGILTMTIVDAMLEGATIKSAFHDTMQWQDTDFLIINSLMGLLSPVALPLFFIAYLVRYLFKALVFVYLKLLG